MYEKFKYRKLVGKFIDVRFSTTDGLLGLAAPDIQIITAIEYAEGQDDNAVFNISTQSQPNPGNIVKQDTYMYVEEIVDALQSGIENNT